MKRLLATVFALLVAQGITQAQTRIPTGFLGTWQSGGVAPTSSPLGAPLPELPYVELDEAIGTFLQPWAFAKHQALEWDLDDTGQVCKLDGIFRHGHATGGAFRFVEAPKKLYQIWGGVDERGLQRIYFDSPHPRNLLPTWGGDSRGRFEGDDTLSVDIIGFNDKSWLNSDRWAHTGQLHVIESYRLYGAGKYMQLRVFVDDRDALKAPYTYTRYYTKMPDVTEGGESVCNENTPDNDLWSIRRHTLLAEHEARFAAFVAKYANEPLPQAPNPTPPAKPAQTTGIAVATGPNAAKLRDLSGVYEGLPLSAAVPGGLKSSGLLSDIALLPAAQEAAKSRNLDFDPAKHCMVIGPFRMMAREGTRFEVLTTEKRITLMFENIALGNKREIYLGRTQHPAKLEPSYLGDSIGHWEGETLVVDTVGFNGATWLNDAGAPHGAALHLIERVRPIQSGHYLEYQVTAEDPNTLAKPYNYTRYYQRGSTELKEDFCEDDIITSRAVEP
jgi:hypothetical protein